MKRIKLFFSCVLLIICVVVSTAYTSSANSLLPSSLLDVNALPAVATDSNDNATITWGYLGLAHMPGILAKQYDANGTPVDNTEFWVNPSFGAISLLNYDPDIATDSTDNAVIVWCSYGLSAIPTSIQVVYKKVGPPLLAGGGTQESSQVTAISPQQTDGITSLLTIPLTPVVAVDSSDNIAIAWSYFDVSTGESGIYLVVIDSGGSAGTPVNVVNNRADSITLSATDEGNNTLAVSQLMVKPVFYYAPSIAFDQEGTIVVTWTETGLVPLIVGGMQIPRSAVFYSKYSTSGAVVSGYDKQLLALGFNSAVSVNDSGTMIIAWNTLDLVSLKIRINAALFPAAETPSEEPLQLGVRSGYTPAAFVDTGTNLLNTGLAITSDSVGNFFVTWSGKSLFSNHIYLKQIDSDGGYLSNEIQVSQGSDVNYGPAIASDSQGNIIITWNKVSFANLFTGVTSVYARRYDNALQAMGDEFKVNLIY